MIGGRRVEVVTKWANGGTDRKEISRRKLRDYLEEQFVAAVSADYGYGAEQEVEDAIFAALDEIWDSAKVRGDVTTYRYTTLDGLVTTWTITEI